MKPIQKKHSALNLMIIFLWVFYLPHIALAGVPLEMNYQGRLSDSGGMFLNGTYDMKFRIYNHPIDGNELWNAPDGEVQNVLITDGIFNVSIGAVVPLSEDIFESTGLYLEIAIYNSDSNNWEIMTPRQHLSSVAYAFRAADADTLDGFDATTFLSTDGGLADLDNSNLLIQGLESFDDGGEEGILYLGDTYNYIKAIRDFGVSIGTFVADDALVVQAGTGNVGIGVTNPTEGKLDVNGLISSRGTGLDCGVRMANPVGNRDYRMIQKDDGRLTITDETAHVERIIMDENGNIGIGTSPSQQLSVYGTIESKGGGFKFPDGSSQTSAGATQVYVSVLEARIASLETKMAALETLLANVTRSGSDITFSGVNVHVVNGTGTTNGTPNGVGNLIIGYNEVRGSGDDRSGSHNIVVGSMNNYSAYGGLVAGRYNTISGSYASVGGGSGNTASGNQAAVTGGANNTASGNNASISGGSYNTASGRSAFVGGGGSGNSSDGNEAFGDYSAILGGHTNLTGDQGKIDHSIGQNATISGGRDNIASGYFSSVSGGRNNQAIGESSSINGGGGDISTNGNLAVGDYTAILGGLGNLAGDGENYFDSIYEKWVLTPGDDHTIGINATVIGGSRNTASGYTSSVFGFQNFATGDGSIVSGGEWNRAVGVSSSVSGGSGNSANGDMSTVSGGVTNRANGYRTSVSGGQLNSADGNWSSISGGVGNTAIGSSTFIGGGQSNRAGGDQSTILGGLNNGTNSNNATVCGGTGNQANNSYATVSGGHDNTASGASSSVSGGQSNTAVNAFDSVVGDAGAVFVDSTPVH